MYYQEVVISPDIFNKIREFFAGNDDIVIDFKSYMDNLSNKKLVLDKNESGDSEIESEIIKIIEGSNDFAKKRIESILKIFLSNSNKIKYILNPVRKKYECNQLYNILFNLGRRTDSKIVNSDDNDFRLTHESINELKDLEVLDFDNFIIPQKNSKIFALKKTVNIHQGERFKFEGYFRPYLCTAKEILISDRYLRSYQAFENLKKILQLCTCIEKLTIQTINRNNNEKDNFDMTIEEFKEEIDKISPVKVLINPNNTPAIHKRFIRTEEYEIIIDTSFNFVNSNYKAVSSFTINFSKI